MLNLDFTPFPELKTDRILLRKLTLEDAPEIFFLRSNEKVLRFIGKEPAASLKEAEEFINRVNAALPKKENILWGITLWDKPHKVIGTICYWRIQPENYRAEIGYVLHPEFWRKGIIKETIQKVLEYGFTTMKLHSVEARTSADNIASAAILEATGFVKEAHLKEEIFFRGNFRDTIIYSQIEK
jgi:[ribosomal protein S5]-alanine N-acetyltransferase